MKKIVPFKKDIEFENNIYQITSISLEHTLSLKEENIISGNFIVSGNYKMTENSINIDVFEYDLPFEINIDKKYDTSEVSVDINDFYYEIVNNKVLAVNIEVSIDGLNERKIKKETSLEERKEQEDELPISSEVTETEEVIDSSEVVSSIFDDLDDNENYVTYKIHIVTENDTIETILQKYETSSSKLELYNNLSDLKVGDKVIIPTND